MLEHVGADVGACKPVYVHLIVRGVSAHIYCILLSHSRATSTALFVRLLHLYVCLLYELPLVALSCFDHVVLIWSESCGVG